MTALMLRRSVALLKGANRISSRSPRSQIPLSEPVSSRFVLPCIEDIAIQEKPGATSLSDAVSQLSSSIQKLSLRDLMISECSTDNRTDDTKTLHSQVVLPSVWEQLELCSRKSDDPALVKEIAEHIQVHRTLHTARSLVGLLQSAASPSEALGQWILQHRHAVDDASAASAAGIASRLKVCGSSQRGRGSLAEAEDVQMNEVLPNGKVVTFTDPTLPDEGSLKSVLDSLNGVRRRCAVTQDDGQGDAMAFLHVIVTHRNVSIQYVMQRIAELCHVDIKSIRANLSLEYRAVITQVISIGVTMKKEAAEDLAAATTLCAALARLNLMALPFHLQLLRWRYFPCSDSATSRVQHTMLIRNIWRHHRTLSSSLQKAALAFPNFFPPESFGPVDCPFRLFHVAAALERGVVREAMAMLCCISAWHFVSSLASSAWMKELLRHVRTGEGEDHHGRSKADLRTLFDAVVPSSLKCQVQEAKSRLLWNVMASSYVRRLSSKRNGVLIPLSAGDYALSSETNQEEGGKSSSCSPAYCADDEEASSFLPTDQVIPLLMCGGAECKTAASMLCRLGFSPTFAQSGIKPPELRFRSLLCRATGFPHTSQPWSKVLQEPDFEAAGNGGTPRIHLASDVQLASGSRHRFTHRGSANVWPIDKRGRMMADRLPSGLLASGTLGGGGRGNCSSCCLALHFTLPASSSAAAFLREVLVVSDERSFTPYGDELPDEREGVDMDQLAGFSVEEGQHSWNTDGDILSLRHR